MKRYLAADLPGALAQVKAELGSDAVILYTRPVRGRGLWGFWRRQIEVMAAVEEPAPAAKSLRPVPPASAATRATPGEHFPSGSATAAQVRGKALAAGEGAVSTPSAFGQEAASAFIPWQPGAVGKKESANTDNEKGAEGAGEEELARLAAQIAIGVRRQEEEAAANLEDVTTPWGDFRAGWERVHEIITDLRERYTLVARPALPGLLPQFYDHLVARGLAPDLVTKILNGVVQEAKEPRFTDRDWVAQAVAAALSRIFPVSGALRPKAERPYRVALVGPTGVGKTTTLAKLAAGLALEQGLRLAFLTSDTYRIAAVEQLRVYAELLRVPLEVALTPADLEEAIARQADKDVLLLDTAGRSQKNARHLAELAAFLQVAAPHETHLVLAANVGEEENREVIRNFRETGFNRLLFTKLDETSSFGVLANLLHVAAVPVSYLTWGQGVPDDIEVARTERLLALVLREEGPHA